MKGNTQKTYVFKVSDNLKDEIIEHYKSTSRDKKPPYSVFQSFDFGTTVTLYESGKIMFQGVSADIDYALWRDREAFLNKRDIDEDILKNEKKKEQKKKELSVTTYKNVSTIGSDEVGTGDYFGPIIVTAAYVSKEKISLIESLGVRDSKKLNDTQIMKVAPKIKDEVIFKTRILTPSEYNRIGITNMNKVKAILHNQVLYDLKNELDSKGIKYDYIVVDQFARVDKYFEHIKYAKNIVREIDFTTHAEDKCLSVACASVISRYAFLTAMENMKKQYNMDIPLGAGSNVDDFGKEFIKKFGVDELKNAVKLNFKNTEKIKGNL